MTNHRKMELGAIGFVIALALVISLSVSFKRADANPLGFSSPALSAVATTTLTYMTPGTATSTFIYDSYGVNGTNQTNTGNTYVPNTLALLTQFSASSSPNSTLNVNVEYSQDLVDWYQDNYFATTTTSDISAPNSFNWTFASSTVGGATVTNNNRIGKVIRIQTPARYVRVIYSLKIGGANGAVWGELLPVKENASR